MVGVLRNLLDSGTLQVGYRLPSIRTLQEISGLRQHDVYRALETLATEGRIEQRRGSGTFVLDSHRKPVRSGSSTLRIGVVPPSWDPGVSHHAVAMFLTGITQQADLRHTIQLVPARLPEQMPLSFAEHVRSVGLDGVLWIKPPVAPPAALVCLVAAGIPSVVVGRSYAHLPVITADYDHSVMGREIADFLIRKGRKKLVCMVGVRNDQLMVNQLAAIRAEMEKRGLALPDDQLVTVRIASAANVYSTDLRESVAKFFRQHEDFDAVFSIYPDQFDVLTAIHESGYRRCPEDFIHIHQGSCNMWGGQQWPPFPTALLSAPSEAVGRQAVKELERLLGVDENPVPEDVGPRIDFDPYEM
jgi:DNA-binding LacI/PurR family transcriptional regulator